MDFSWEMHSHFWIEQGTVQKCEAGSSGEKKNNVSDWTAHFQMSEKQ